MNDRDVGRAWAAQKRFLGVQTKYQSECDEHGLEYCDIGIFYGPFCILRVRQPRVLPNSGLPPLLRSGPALVVGVLVVVLALTGRSARRTRLRSLRGGHISVYQETVSARFVYT